MILFSNIWEKASKRNSTFLCGQASVTALQLLNAAFNDMNLAEVLLNHGSSIQEYLDSKGLGFDKDQTTGLDFSRIYTDNDESKFYALAKTTDADLDMTIQCAMEDCAWMSVELFQKLTDVVMNIAHLESMVYLLDGSKSQELELTNTRSIENLAQDFSLISSIASVNIEKQYKPTAIDLHQNLVGSMDYLSSHSLKGEISLERLGMITKLQNILTRIAVDFSSVNNETKMVDVEWSDNQRYNQANKHLNENYMVGGIFLPKQLFENLPFSNAQNDGIYRIVPYYNCSQEIEIDQVPALISYTLDTACDCEHDCCACATDSFYTEKLNRQFMLIRRSVSVNV